MHASTPRIALALALALAGGCDDDDSGAADAAVATWAGAAVLAAPGDWRRVEAGADPFADRPAQAECPDHGATAEDGRFEVETDICRYGTFAHTVDVELLPGDTIEATVWHLELWAPERAEGHVALRLGDRLLWEARVPIPGQEAVYPVSVTLEDGAPAGSVLYFHVHNHGANSWRLLDVQARRD